MATSSKPYENEAVFLLIKKCLNDSESAVIILESLHAAYHRALVKKPKKPDNNKPENDKPESDELKIDKPGKDKPKDYALEQDTARYAMMLFSIFFSNGHWNMVPQLYTNEGGIPDLVLETFRRVVHRSYIKVYIEFKGVNGKNIYAAAEQVSKAISSQYGRSFHDYGMFIAISGSEWLIMEYNAAKDGDEMDLEFYPLTATMPMSHGFSGGQSKYRDNFPLPPRDLGAPYTGMRKDGTIEKATYNWRNGMFQKGGSSYKIEKYVLDFGKDFAYIACLMHWISITRGNGVRKWSTEREREETFASLSTMAIDYEPEEGQPLMRSMPQIDEFEENFLERFSEKIQIEKHVEKEVSESEEFFYIGNMGLLD